MLTSLDRRELRRQVFALETFRPPHPFLCLAFQLSLAGRRMLNDARLLLHHLSRRGSVSTLGTSPMRRCIALRPRRSPRRGVVRLSTSAWFVLFRLVGPGLLTSVAATSLRNCVQGDARGRSDSKGAHRRSQGGLQEHLFRVLCAL